jgi:hypothetical protein
MKDLGNRTQLITPGIAGLLLVVTILLSTGLILIGRYWL